MRPPRAYCGITPLKVDLTDHAHLRYWGQTVAQLGACAKRERGLKRRPGFPAKLDFQSGKPTAPKAVAPKSAATKPVAPN
jgi:hypothetical protein